MDNINHPYIKLENKGHLADTILRHIIINYNNLADVTFFTHGSFNYRNDQLIKEDGIFHKYFKDFIKVDKDTLVYIKRRDLPKSDYKFYDYDECVGDVYKYILMMLTILILSGLVVNGYQLVKKELEKHH